ncbi:MAG: M20/M25/M40 family metallo-hydrolase [Thermoleophilaceae bacterium]
MDDWIEQAAVEIAARAEGEIGALVGVSSPSGDVEGAERVLALVAEMLPHGAAAGRLACSSPGHAPDMVARLEGTGDGRLLLLGHADTVIAHAAHVPLHAERGRLVGSGAIDMKGGVALALGVMRALAGAPERYAEVALLIVCDEEWRTADFAHGPLFAGWDGCLCFEAGERTAEGGEGVVVHRKAAGTLQVTATGRAAHSGAAPQEGRNALLALARVAGRVADAHDPTGPTRLSAVPTVMHAGESFNVVPPAGELWCDLRADRLAAFEPLLAEIPAEDGGVALAPRLVRRWPGMDTRARAAPAIAAAGAALGRPVAGTHRGGASDASHLAGHVALTIDGVGPLGAGAHAPHEHVEAGSLRDRAELALALAAAVLG